VPSCLQHELVGVEELPVMKSRHGDRLTMALVQLLDWADAPTNSTVTRIVAEAKKNSTLGAIRLSY